MKRRGFIQTMLSMAAIGSLSSLDTIASTLTEKGKRMPVLFIGHGSPMNAIEKNEFSNQWSKLGQTLPRPNLILCVSAHWLTRGTFVTAGKQPETIHDFGGFPQELFNVQYPAKGSPEVAQSLKETITEIELDHKHGYDHGSWSIIKQMYPDANIPVLQLSIDYRKGGEYHYQLAQQLKSLRRKGVLIIGSGNMIHNLGMVGFKAGTSTRDLNAEYGYDWALDINDRFKQLIRENNHKALIHYQQLGEAAQLAIPTPDHYFPLLYTLGLQEPGDNIQIFNDKCIAGSLSMTSVQMG